MHAAIHDTNTIRYWMHYRDVHKGDDYDEHNMKTMNNKEGHVNIGARICQRLVLTTNTLIFARGQERKLKVHCLPSVTGFSSNLVFNLAEHPKLLY